MAKRRKKIDWASAGAALGGSVAGAGVAWALGKLHAPPLAVGASIAALGLGGAVLTEGRTRLALGSTTGAGLLVLAAAGNSRAKAQPQPQRERVASAERPKKKDGRDADLNDDVVALFEAARTDLALDDEEREASRYYRDAA